MTYLDTSCLMKLLREEPETDVVRSAITSEDVVLVSPLAELECEIALKALVGGGTIRLAQRRHAQGQLVAMRNLDPFHFVTLPASVFSTSLRQTRRPDSVHCRALDRLHLAAAEELRAQRIMTLDQTQAKVAQSLGFEVLSPGRS